MILIVFNIILVQSLDCSVKQNQYTIYPSIGETQEWDMRLHFFEGQDLSFSLSDLDQSQFAIKQPIEPIGPQKNHQLTVSMIKGFKPLRQYQNGVWLNKFIFMEQDDTSVDIMYSTNYPYQTDQVPAFDKFVNVQKNQQNIACYDLDFITQDKFVADCAYITTEIQNAFIVVDSVAQTSQVINNDNPKEYSKVDARKIIVNEFTFSDQTKQQVLIRGEPAYATENADLTKKPPKLDEDCELEVYKISNNLPESKYKSVLDKTKLSALTGETINKFMLVDFQVEPNGDIYILDATQGIFIFNLNSNLDWVFKEWIKQQYIAYAYGFDINYLALPDGTFNKHLVVMYEKNMNTYLNGVQQNGYTLKITAQYGVTSIQMSQQYVIITHQRTLYLYSSFKNILINSDPMSEVDVILINPYEPDIIGLSQYASHRYLVSNGFLRLLSQAGKTDFVDTINVIAQAKNGDRCQVQVQWQIVDKDDTKIYSITNTLPLIHKYPSAPILINRLASGPNLQYQPLQLKNDDIEIDVKSSWQLKVTNVELPDAKSIAYSDILAFQDSQRFYLLLQILDKTVYIYQCEHKIQFKDRVSCKQQEEIKLQVLLTKKNQSFTWWMNFNQIVYYFQESDKIISLYASTFGKSDLIEQIEYTTKIDSFTVLKNYIYVVSNNIVDVWSNKFPIEKKYSISDLSSQGVVGFNPKRVFGNKEMKSDIIFIQTSKQVIMGVYASTFTILHLFDIIEDSEIDVSLSDKTLFIIQKKGDLQQIDQYNYVHLQHIYKTQSLPLYNYKLQEPLTVDYSAQSGWLFVRALDVQLQKTVILVYEPNVLHHASLHKVLNTQAYLTEGDVFDMSVDGREQMFIYFNDEKMHTLLVLLKEAYLQFVPPTDEPDYVNKVRGGLTISNSQSKLDIVKDFTILNTQSHITIKENSISEIQINQSNELVALIVELSNNWYHGQCTDMFIDCEQCFDYVTLRPPIAQVTNGDGLKTQHITDAQQYGDYIIFQTSNSILFTDQDAKLLKTVKLTQQNLELVTTTSDKQFIFSTYQAGIYVTNCNGLECAPYKQKNLDLNDLTYISKIKMIDISYVALLNSNPSSFKSFENSIYIYQFQNTDPTQFQLVNPKIINTNTFSSTTQLYFGDFDIINFKVGGQTYYKVFLTDLENGLGLVDAVNDNTFSMIYHQLYNLRKFQDDQFYVDSDTQFLQVRVLTQSEQSNNLEVKVLVSTSNSAQYIFKIKFNIQDPSHGSPIQSVELKQVLTPYGDWQSIDKVITQGNYIAVPYTDQNNIVIGTYNLSDDKEITPFIYGIQTDYFMPIPIDFALLLTLEGDNAFLWTNIIYSDQEMEHVLLKYSISNQPSLLITNAGQLKEQKLSFHLENAFGFQIGESSFVFHHDHPTDTSDWWWITLIVVGVLLILGVAGYFGYKKFGKKAVEPLLG